MVHSANPPGAPLLIRPPSGSGNLQPWWITPQGLPCRDLSRGERLAISMDPTARRRARLLLGRGPAWLLKTISRVAWVSRGEAAFRGAPAQWSGCQEGRLPSGARTCTVVWVSGGEAAFRCTSAWWSGEAGEPSSLHVSLAVPGPVWPQTSLVHLFAPKK